MPEEFVTDEDIRVRVANLTRDDYRWTRFFLEQLESVVKELPAPKGAVPFPCEIDFAPKSRTGKNASGIKLFSRNGGVRALLPAEAARWRGDRSVHERLILIVAARRLGRFPDPDSRLPGWLLGAMLSKLDRRLEGGGLPGPRVYPVAHGLLMNGIHPNVWTLIENAPPVADEPFYDAYAELCELLWNAVKRLRGDWRKAVAVMLTKSLAGVEADDETLFLDTIGRLIVERNSDNLSEYYMLGNAAIGGDAVRWWFLQEFRRRAVSLHMPGNVQFAEREFERVKTFECLPVAVDEEGGADAFVEPVTITLEELPEKWEQIGERGELLNKLERNFISLRYELPEEFHPTFNIFLEGFEDLRYDGDPSEFAEVVSAGNRAFKLGVIKRRALEDYLKEVERSLVPPGVRRSHSFEVIAAWRRRGHSFWPALNRYLDRVEQKFGKRPLDER